MAQDGVSLPVDSWREEIKQALLKEVLDCVGEDETLELVNEYHWNRLRHQDALRQEIRQKITELFK
jgi:hypothetical protein